MIAGMERPKSPQRQANPDDPMQLGPALREQARRWFAEAREQTRRDDEEIAAWRRGTGGSRCEGGFG